MKQINDITYDVWLRDCLLPRLEARLLLQEVSGLSHAQLIAHGENVLPAAQRVLLDGLAARRLQGEPLAYILGKREFYGRLFGVSLAVLIPRPETEHVVDAVLARLPENGTVWDLGTGSGAIAVTLACERPDADVWASDISASALQRARSNAQHWHCTVEFSQGSWFDAQPQPARHSVDIVVSNPPYIEAGNHHLQQGDLRFEPQNALTDFADGLSAIRMLVDGAPDYLKSGGWLIMEHGFDQGEAVRALLYRRGFNAVTTLPDLAGLERVSLGQWQSPQPSPPIKPA